MKRIGVGIIGTGWCGGIRAETCAANPLVSSLHVAEIRPDRLDEIAKATNADSAEKALLSFPGDIYWILGGKPKTGGIAGLANHFPRIAKAYLIGEATEEFAASLGDRVPFERCGTLDVAAIAAARDAAASRAAEPVVLLSPACASFDQFRNFEVRGDAFRARVAALPGIEMKGGSA